MDNNNADKPVEGKPVEGVVALPAIVIDGKPAAPSSLDALLATEGELAVASPVAAAAATSHADPEAEAETEGGAPDEEGDTLDGLLAQGNTMGEEEETMAEERERLEREREKEVAQVEKEKEEKPSHAQASLDALPAAGGEEIPLSPVEVPVPAPVPAKPEPEVLSVDTQTASPAPAPAPETQTHTSTALDALLAAGETPLSPVTPVEAPAPVVQAPAALETTSALDALLAETPLSPVTPLEAPAPVVQAPAALDTITIAPPTTTTSLDALLSPVDAPAPEIPSTTASNATHTSNTSTPDEEDMNILSPSSTASFATGGTTSTPALSEGTSTPTSAAPSSPTSPSTPTMEQVPITPVARKQPKISVNGATNDNDDEEPETPISPPAFRAKTTPSWPPSRSEEELAKVVAEEEAGVAASTEPSATSTSNDTAKGVEGTSTDVEGAPPVPAKEAPTPPPKTAESKPPLVVPPVSLPITPAETAKALASANRGFDYLFANEIGLARETFGGAESPRNSLASSTGGGTSTGVVEVSPFHLLGLGVCAFLEAALGMESGLMGEASRLLTASEAGARRAGAEVRKGVVEREKERARKGKSVLLTPGEDGAEKEKERGDGGGRFTPGTEYEILGADAVVLIGLTHALSESYMGYFQCMYALNAAHSKFTKLYKTVFPAGLEQYEARSASRAASRAASITSGSVSRAASISDVPATTGTLEVESNVSASVSSVSIAESTADSVVTTDTTTTTTTTASTTTTTDASPMGTPPVVHTPPVITTTPPPAPETPSTPGTPAESVNGDGRPGLPHSPSSVSVASTGGGGIKSLFGRWGKRNSSSVSLTGEAKEKADALAAEKAAEKQRLAQEKAAKAAALAQEKAAKAAALAKEKAAKDAKDKAEREVREAREKVERERAPEGEVEEMIVAGTAFGFGLFNLVFSLLPKKVQSLVGLLGFKHDRALALRALAVSAGIDTLGEGEEAGRDVHGVFAGLVLMTFHGVVLLLSGYQADEARTLKTYKAIVDRIEARYPTGALWLLNRAKILRMSNDPQGAIAVLQRALEAPQTFVQADTLLVFELAWTLLAQRRHQEAADAFVKLTELNSWSHATYYFIAAGCYVSLGNRDKAQELFDAIPELLTRKKVGGKDLPTEVLIRKKLEFYKEKQKRRGGDPARFVDCISISPADELAIFWNTHQRIDDAVAEAHIAELAALTPPVALAVPSPYLPVVDEKHTLEPHPDQPSQDLDTPDERALRALLLGIMHRTLRLYAPARALLEAARGMQGVKVSTWIAGVALFELAVTDLKEADGGASAHKEKGKGPEMDKAAWARVLSGADSKLDGALGMAGKSDIDLSSRLDSRIALLRDEIAAKRAMVGL